MLRDAAYLTAWLRSWRSGLVSLDQALDSIAPFEGGLRDSELTDSAGEPWDWVEATQFISSDPDQIRLVLPIPGDIRGLPIETHLRLAAMKAGAAIIAGHIALIPLHENHQSGSGDTWTTHRWQAWPFLRTPDIEPISLAEADVALSEATRDALSVLEALPSGDHRDLVPYTDEAALPPGFAPRARRLFARAWTIHQLLAHAEEPIAQSVSARDQELRQSVLTPLAHSARIALIVACSAPLRPDQV